MKTSTRDADAHCLGCVYYPPNLPAAGYAPDDYGMLQEKACSFDYLPGDRDCRETRKTSCSLVDLTHFAQTLDPAEKA